MSRSLFVKKLSVLGVALLLALPAFAQSRRGVGQRSRSAPGTGDPESDLAPWLYIEKGATLPITTPLVLYWLPASSEEMERSPLLTSRALIADSASCVALEAVVPDNEAMAAKLGAAGRLPMAVLTDRHGNVVRRVENVGGALRQPAVEQMVADELSARNEAMYHDITEARRRAGTGNKQGAIDRYQKIWDDRCLFPLAGEEAKKALKALGVVVQEPAATLASDPYLNAPPSALPESKQAPGKSRNPPGSQ